jgi:hypothetical protein
MLDLHRQFIVDNTTPELMVVITNAHEVLTTLGRTDIDDSLEELIMLDSTVEAGETVNEIVNRLRDCQQDMLRQHEVHVIDTAPLALSTHLLRGILAMQDYEDMEAIYRITTSDQDPIDTFAEAMALLTPYNTENLVVSLEEVGTSLVRRMREMAGTRDEELVTDEERVERAKYVSRINQFCHYTRSRHYRLMTLLQSGWSVGYPYVTYADNMGRDFEGILPDQIAKEMIVMALASVDGANNPRIVIKQHLERYIASINVITKVDIEVSRLLQGFDHG